MGKHSSYTGVALLITVLALTGCASGGTAAESESSPTPTTDPKLHFKGVALACGVADYSEILDDGQAIELTGVGQNLNSPVQLENVQCVLKKLDAPTAVASKIGQTRALDGRQSDEWEGYEASWTYHPDDGASIIIERTE
ncbi:hypothetical protein Q9R08_05285 [Microbacterium sp. QXD-8]|uniref:Lipoprotein n=1 Tax=Microbacterium psychrotolerans TaxID=3068321 RepID=A0ABU0YYI7_9MICO|nr:hypothetical protein [Microbacterium sp. QXD-8]MDQ7877387.1 hypothetical protein [Microbacterium sp. QXD-8]